MPTDAKASSDPYRQGYGYNYCMCAYTIIHSNKTFTQCYGE